MKTGTRVAFKEDKQKTGTVIAVEQYGNTQTYLVQWDNGCPNTGYRKAPTHILKTEVVEVK